MRAGPGSSSGTHTGATPLRNHMGAAPLTALHLAASHGHFDLVKFLVEGERGGLDGWGFMLLGLGVWKEKYALSRV